MSTMFNDWLTRRMMSSVGGGGLPSEYQGVEYLICDGVAYIVLQNDFYSELPGFDIKFRKTKSVDNYGPHIISHSQTNLWVVPRPYNNGAIYLRGTSTVGFGTSFPINNDFIMSFGVDGTNNIYINGASVKTATIGSGTSSGTLGMFYYPGELKDRWKLKGWLYYAKIYDSGQLVYDLVPCYRKSDNVPGLYCLKHSTFYTNANSSGSFSVGNNL